MPSPDETLERPLERLAALHVAPEAQLKRHLAAGTFWSAATCDDDMISDNDLDKTFQNEVGVRLPSVLEPETAVLGTEVAWS
jgi:hypothetical protein